MSYIAVRPEHAPDLNALPEFCPFGAIMVEEGQVIITGGCRMCRLCIKNGPPGVFELVEGEPAPAADKAAWSGIAVYIELYENTIHPVSLEMVGKARELADKVGQKVFALLIGDAVSPALLEELSCYGIDSIYLYESPQLKHFRIEPYTAVFEDFIRCLHPAAVLTGGTPVGRMLAPRTAARLHTGLTADCTIVDIQDTTDLDQIRPAFGGNIMAHIRTLRHRPQFATVRYKIFPMPVRRISPSGKLTRIQPAPRLLKSGVEVLAVHRKEKVKHLEEADVIVAAGRGIGSRENMAMIERLAQLLQAEVAGTRPLIEDGWIDPRRQIGLSGRTVRPKLIITCGVSGSVQFAAGMSSAEMIIAINSDPDAPIFSIAHVAVVGDVHRVIPELIEAVERREAVHEAAVL
jgi:electron transfer flavoprotein alpha subunit